MRRTRSAKHRALAEAVSKQGFETNLPFEDALVGPAGLTSRGEIRQIANFYQHRYHGSFLYDVHEPALHSRQPNTAQLSKHTANRSNRRMLSMR